ncbi:MAG: 16S rRNA (uracil(1498)-N(3))-methyltransferase [Betaproteobacteria bacterium]|nr:16S rRNA (uracil(1498)-N(3))-methyltransferase [Betaproteobacteria bacterium]NBY17310.1 16S rRNA (uracil(1498)-N(3))-methyltransferase [Betaproteobacteria bacterium]
MQDDSLMKPRFLLSPDQLVASARVELPAEAAHHAVRVLRLGAGAVLEIFDGAGRRATATVLSTDRDRCTVEIDAAILSSVTKSLLQITLLQGIAAADRMDWIIEKSIELGVDRVVPMMAQRSTVKLDADRAKKRHLHWQRIAVAACMQCGQDQLPTVDSPLPARTAFAEFAEFAEFVHHPAGLSQRLILDPLAPDSLVQTVRSLMTDDLATNHTTNLADRSSWVLAVGPESGFDLDEIEAAKRAGFKPVRMGPRVLRTETAGPAAIAALQTLCGDF